MSLTKEAYERIKRNSSIEIINPETEENQIAYEKKVFEILLAFEGISVQEYISFYKANKAEK